MAEHEVKEQDKSDELVDMIEKLMEDGSGHLTISEDDLMGEGLNVKTYRSMDCSKGNMACCQPTEIYRGRVSFSPVPRISRFVNSQGGIYHGKRKAN